MKEVIEKRKLEMELTQIRSRERRLRVSWERFLVARNIKSDASVSKIVLVALKLETHQHSRADKADTESYFRSIEAR